MKTRLRKGFLAVPVFFLCCFLTGALVAQDQGYPQNPPDQGYSQDQGYPPGQQDQNGNPPGVAARISEMEGNVSFQPGGQGDWGPATLNYTMTTGDRIYTDQGANAELEVGPYTVRMGGNTDLTMANLTDQLMQLGVAQGTVRVGVYDLAQGDAVEIDTPNGAVNALQDGSYRVDIDPNNGTRLIVESGSAQITGGDLNQTIAAGQAVYLSGTNPIQMSSIAFPRPDGFDGWYESRDRHLEELRSRESQYVNPYIPGAGDLDQYGTWQAQSQYGPVWYPSSVPADWVPYRQGHWAYEQPWGWTWVDDEPWGYAPFHYGRWAHIGDRWGWIPGPVDVQPVYSPALVAFAGGSGFSISVGIGGGGGGLAAWFPLGPTDPYIPWYHYQGDYLRRVNVTNVRNVTNITNITRVVNTTNVNSINTTNIHYAYRTVATTAVPAAAFSSGKPVARSVVHVAPAQMAKARVIVSPKLAPARTAAFAGRGPVKAPPVRNVKLVVPRHPVVAHPNPHVGPARSPARPPAGPARTPAGHPAVAPHAGPARSPAHPAAAAHPTMPGARPVPGPRAHPPAHPAPRAERPAPAAHPEAGPAPRAARPIPGARSTPARVHPNARPTPVHPEARPAPERVRPNPHPTPVRPEARPAPVRRAPVTRPTPQRRPEARPAPRQVRPAPGVEPRRVTPPRRQPPAPSEHRPQQKEQKKPQG
jgi:hypothetical protein